MECQLWNSLWWPIYVINSIDNTKLPCCTLPPTQHHSFFRNLPPLFISQGCIGIGDCCNEAYLPVCNNNKGSCFLSAGDEDISTVDSATLKQAYAGLVTMILEAIKMDCDSSSIRLTWTFSNIITYHVVRWKAMHREKGVLALHHWLQQSDDAQNISFRNF